MNYLTYPTKVMNITQNHLQGNHAKHAPDDFPFDEACADGGRDWFYCPCDAMEIKKIYGVGTGGTNTVWLESRSPVTMPIGGADITMMVEHIEDDDLQKLSVGQVFRRGEKMFREGKDGATGNHFHISVACGKMRGTGWRNNGKAWVLTTAGKPLKADEAFYVENVRVRNAAGYSFKTKPKEDTMDNTPDKYAEKAVQWAKDEGILQGNDKGDLKLHDSITRQDAIVLLYRSRNK